MSSNCCFLLATSMAVATSLAGAARAQPANPPAPEITILNPARLGCLLFPEWYAYRHDASRAGSQPCASNLSNPAKLGNLAVKWSFPTAGKPPVGGFKASPIVVNDTVYIGSMDGYLYALDAATGKLKWQFPKPPAKLSVSYPGIQSSATYAAKPAVIHPGRPIGPIVQEGLVIFGAQDPALGPSGNARLFAVDANTGALYWKSPQLATINGSGCNTNQLHQSIKYSSPLVFDNKVYVGIHNFGDNPIQVGRVVAVDLANGNIDPTFRFRSVGTNASPPGTRGGGVWNSPATDGAGVYFTTGNTRTDCASPEGGPGQGKPNPEHGRSMVRVDRNSGKTIWAWQPVPYAQDHDPDWAAGAAVMRASCGTLLASVQKDGWAYAVNAGNGTPGVPSLRWQFPPTGFGATFLNAAHGDDDYKRPGAAWNDVLFITTGGESLVNDGVKAGYGRLHALNACASSAKDRVRWIADIPHNSKSGYSLGAPTVTGGIVFIGTDQGHLVVLADPSVSPGSGFRCSDIDYSAPFVCIVTGHTLVPIPKMLADIAMPDGGNIAGLRDEPALAKGRVFVATAKGHVYMLEP